jgi:hypothetical protein
MTRPKKVAIQTPMKKALLLTCLLVGCAGAQAASRARPSYGEREHALFDDSIEPAAVGLDLDRSYTPSGDPLFASRVREADGVVRAKVVSVSARTSEHRGMYTLTLMPLEEQALGPFPPSGAFTVAVDESSPSVGIVKHLEGGLVGKTFVVFTKEFQRADGDHELHAHLAPDTKATVRAITDIRAKEELKH